MHVNFKVWSERRKAFMKRLKRDKETGYFDKELESIVDLLNSFDDMFTTSSCAGRLMIFSSEKPWDKKTIKIYLKSHEPISVSDVKKIIDNVVDDNLWFVMQPPIIHVSCSTVERAQELLKIARNVGFKHSGIISFSRNGIHVELQGNEHLEFPLRIRGKTIIRKRYLGELVKWANNLLLRSKEKIFKLELEIRSKWLGEG